MKITAETKSDQLNADDLISGPETYTIKGVRKGTSTHPYDVDLEEVSGRVWRPPKTVRAILIDAWGSDRRDWVGKRVTLYRDETVKFGGKPDPGIRVSHASGLPGNKPFTTRLITVAKGRRERFTLEPITDTPKPAENQPPEQVTKAITAFESIGVTVAQLETKLGKTTADWTPDDVQQLGQIFAAINEGHTTAEFEFGGQS